MNEVKVLTLLELRDFYGINRNRYTKDKKAKKRYYVTMAAMVYLLLFVGGYVGIQTYGLCALGLKDLAPAYLALTSSALILIFGVFKAGYKLFSPKGYELLSSMPLKVRSIVLSRFLCLYVEDLVWTLAVMLPGLSVYAFCAQPPFFFYITAVLGTLFIPAIPLVVSALIGTLIMAISSKMKRKSIAQTAISLLILLASLAIPFSMQEMSEEELMNQLANLAVMLSGLIGQIYPPAVWFGNATVKFDILQLLLFVGVSVAVVAVTVAIVSKIFHGVIRRLAASESKGNYKIEKLQSQSLLKTLYLREMKRYFSSSIYVTNTILGPILGCGLSIAVGVMGEQFLQSQFPTPIDIVGLLPFALAAVFTMMTTTCTSLSMEGKQFWVIRSLPIGAKPLFDSKILLNLTLILPFYLVGEVALFFALQPSVTELLWLLVIPLTVIVFAVVFGITANVISHQFDWESEVHVVKQSATAFFGGFIGPVLSIVLGAAVLFAPPAFADVVKAVVCAVLWTVTIILYQKNNKTVLSEL